MSNDKLKAKQAERQRAAMQEARARVAEQEAAARAAQGLPPVEAPRGPWSADELKAAIADARAAFPADMAIEVATLFAKDRSLSLPGYQSASEPLKAKPEARRGHVMFFVPVMRHHVVIYFDADARKVETACSHEANFHRWTPAPARQSSTAAKRAA